MGLSVLTAVLAAAAVPPLGLAWALHRQPTVPGTTPYAGLLFLLGLWTTLEAITTLAGQPATHRILDGGIASLRVLAAGVFLFFALEYTGRALQSARGLLLAAAGAAVLTTVLHLADPTTGLLWTGYRLESAGAAIVADASYGPWLGLVGLAAAGALVTGCWLLAEQAATDPGRYARETALLSLVAVLPAVGIVRRTVEIGPFPHVAVASIGTGCVVPVLWLSLHRGNLFEAAPAARRVGQVAAIDDLGDAVFVVDEADRMVKVNARAQALFGDDNEALVGRPLSSIVGESIPLEDSEAIVRLRTPAGRRAFRISASPVHGVRGTVIGRTLVLADVTEELHRRQRFQVLNRILRHNVRNVMNAVAGYAGQLESVVDDETRWMVERIKRQTTHLVELGDRAGTIERITAPVSEPERVDVGGVLHRVTSTLADTESSSIAIDAPGELAVTTIRPVFEEAVVAAVKSLRAADETAELRIAATATDDWVKIRVESNGEPVPADERAVIEAGEETALSHCRNIDPWLAAWSVETLGGAVDFQTSPACVEFQVPDRPG